jgi:hypothetical protein
MEDGQRFLSSTNVVMIVPIYYAIQNSHYVQAAALFFAGMTSFWYHLNISNMTRQVSFQSVGHRGIIDSLLIDRLGAFSAIVSHLSLLKKYMERRNDYALIKIAVAALILERHLQSKMNPTRSWGLNKEQRVYLKCLYVFLHGIWHIAASALAKPLHHLRLS